MALTSLRWASPLVRQAVASSKAGPSSMPLNRFSSTALRGDDTEVSWMSTLKDANLASPSPVVDEVPSSQQPATSTFRSSSIPGFRSSPSTYLSRMNRGKKPFNLHIKSSRNNTILCLTDSEGSPVTRVSTGQLGFKHAARSGYEAGHQTAIRMFTIIGENKTKWRIADLNLVYNGFGLGREAVHRAMLTDEGTQIRNIVREVRDATKIRIGGVRGRKRRML